MTDKANVPGEAHTIDKAHKEPEFKEPAIGDQVPMPADEQVAENIERISGRVDTPKTVPLTEEMQKEKKDAKASDSKDEVVVDPNAIPAPAGYDEHGQLLRTEEQRAHTGAPTQEEQQKLDENLAEIERKAKTDSDAAKKAVETSAEKKADHEVATDQCVCGHVSGTHTGPETKCTFTEGDRYCDCTKYRKKGGQ